MLRPALATLARVSPTARAYLVGSALLGAAHAVTWTFLARWLNVQGHSKTGIGTFQSMDAWGKAAIAIPAALLLARLPARRVFVTAAVVTGACYLALPLAPTFAALCGLNFVAGLASTVHYVAIAPFLFRHTSGVERAAVFGLAEAARTFAAVVASGVAGVAVEALVGPLGSEAAASGAVIGSAGVVALLAAASYARIRDPEPSVERGRPILPVVRAHRGVLARFAAPQLLISTGAGFCIPFLPTYFQERFSVEPGGWGVLFAGGQVLMTVGFLSTPWLLARLGFVRSMVTIELCSLPFFALLAFTTSLPLAAFAFLMRGALMNTSHPLLKNLMMQATPPGVREAQTGINATIWGIGWVVGPLAAGLVLDATGDDYAVLMTATMGTYAVAALLTWLLLRPVERGLRDRT